MGKLKSVNTERIQWCAKDAGLSIEELADATGVSFNKIRQVFGSKDTFNITEIKKIAKYFNRGLLFFFEKAPVKESKIRTAGFRTLANDKPQLDPKVKGIIEQVERQREVFLSIKEEIGDRELTEFQSPGALPSSVPEAAAIVRDWLSIGSRMNFDSYRKAIEAREILVFRSNGYAGAWKIPSESPVIGFSIYHQVYPIIFVRKQDSLERQLFTLIHELAHLLIHGGGLLDDESDLNSHQAREKTANSFAGQLLVPNSFLDEISIVNKPDSADEFENWLRPLTRNWGVSFEVVLRRLLDSKFITKSDYRKYREWKKTIVYPKKEGGNRQYRYREPKHIFGDTYVATVLDALNSKTITLNRASSYLDNIKIRDIHKLQKFYASV